MITVAAVVEGDGEVRALPALVRRLAGEHGVYGVAVPPPYRLVAAVREYESVLLAAEGMDAAEAEARRDAKGELRRLLGSYRETVHQARLSAVLDLDRARECRWFRKFDKELPAILRG